MNKRVEIINEFIEFLSTKDRNFYRGKKGTSKFSIKKGIVHYTDEHNGICKQVRMGEEVSNMGWVCHGSTMTHQIINFAEFIWTGEPTDLCLYYSGICYEQQLEIHKEAYNLGVIDHSTFHFHDYKNECNVKVSSIRGLNLRENK